jgi:hypothetical protein
MHYYNTLKSNNSAVKANETQKDNAILSRNQILYNPNTGLVDIALSTKSYIKSVFGATSPQYKQVSGLVFRSIAHDQISNEVFITNEVPVT